MCSTEACAHTSNEYMEIDSLISYYNLPMLLIKTLVERKNICEVKNDKRRIIKPNR